MYIGKPALKVRNSAGISLYHETVTMQFPVDYTFLQHLRGGIYAEFF
jgi:hypothetical protein